MGPLDAVRRNSLILLGIYLVLTLGLGAVGYLYYRNQKAGIQARVRDELVAVAELKVRQVIAWKRERLADAKVLMATQMMPSVRVLLEGSQDPKAKAEILAWLETFRDVEGYANAILVNSQGRVCLSAGRAAGAPELYAAIARQALAEGQVIFTDLHYDSGLGGPHMGLNVPIRSTFQGKPDGAVLLGIDPNQFLYPLIESWPGASRSAETLLVRREGNEVLFLSELRHREGAALRLRLPLSDMQVPAVRAALGLQGIVDGHDYRGTRVLAAIRKVPDSPWSLVAKVDADEIYAPIHAQALWLALTLAGLTLAAGTGVAFTWHRLESGFYRQKYEAELEQKRSRALLNSVIEATSDMVYVKDIDGRYLLVNSALCHAGGRPASEILGQDDTAVFSPPAAKAIMDRDREIMTNRETVTMEEEVTFRTGATRTCLSAKGPLMDHSENVTGLFAIIRDITERKHSDDERARLQEQLQHAQKMESIGRLAGGVAHDFNNLLTVINGYAELVERGLPEGDPLRRSVIEIGKAGQRAASLTQQLLAFSRKQIVEPRVIDVNEVVRDAGKMLQRLVGEHIEVTIVQAPKLGGVLADPGQLTQVLMNLAVNARDAMPEGGRLVIETSEVQIGDDYVASHANTRAGHFVLVTISDTGVGMDEATRQRAFEPFFTTKPEGEGTGLGLSTVYGIVNQSGGWIWMYSEVGSGTTFKVYLPRIEAPAESPGAIAESSSLEGTETILVVEDQAAVREMTAEILNQYGYEVLEAANGTEALLLSERFPNRIHLLITDVIMPGMNGYDLSVRFASLRPTMKVLFISGYTADMIARQGVLEPGAALLSKPFTPDALARKVRELLREDGASPQA